MKEGCGSRGEKSDVEFEDKDEVAKTASVQQVGVSNRTITFTMLPQ